MVWIEKAQTRVAAAVRNIGTLAFSELAKGVLDEHKSALALLLASRLLRVKRPDSNHLAAWEYLFQAPTPAVARRLSLVRPEWLDAVAWDALARLESRAVVRCRRRVTQPLTVAVDGHSILEEVSLLRAVEANESGRWMRFVNEPLPLFADLTRDALVFTEQRRH